MKTYLKLIALTLGIFITLSCDKGEKETNKEYSVAEKQLIIDYPNYKLSDVKWTIEHGYHVARFSAQTKSAVATMTVWYSVTGDKANRQMDTEDLGTTIPQLISAAFQATVYSNTALWTIDEVELEHRYNGNGIEKVYEVELDSKTITNLEAELYFSATTGALLYSKESVDNENDDNDDKFVVNQELTAAVEELYPGAQIIDAEVEDNQIEVEAIITVNNKKTEIELIFTMNYILVESEEEYKTTYGGLATEFSAVAASAIGAWFSNNTSYPTPVANTEVEITQGNLFEDDFTPILNYKYGVDIEYKEGQIEYEVMFYLDAEYKILKEKAEID